jgi:putative ABC transport system substrate-binding protein
LQELPDQRLRGLPRERSTAVKQATTTIPIVMVNATDPVGRGFASSLAHPGGNITGLVQAESTELAGKRIQLFKDAVPHISRLAVVMNPQVHQGTWNVLQHSGLSLGIVSTPVWARQGTEIPDALSEAIAARPDALFAWGTFGLSYRKIIVDFASDHRLPSMYNFAEPVHDGGLIAYATNRPDLFRRAALYVAKILNGAKPAELAIEQPTKYDLVVNLKTARILGLTIPREFLLIANEVIE